MSRETPPTLPANASVITRVRTTIRALEVLADDPANPDYVRGHRP